MEADLDLELLRQLCETPGIASREDQIRRVVVEAMRPLVDEMRADALGNVVGVRHGSGPRVMIAAHMDEIGFLVKHVDDKGFLRLQPVGGFDERVLIAQRVLVHGHDGQTYRGALQPAAKPIHLLDRSEIKPPKLEELFVDLGLPAEQVKAAVEPGDMVTLERRLEPAGDCVMSKALDDRVGLFVMLEALRATGKTNAEIAAVATVQEEVGLRGARTAAFSVQPDIAIALDVTLAVDTPGAPLESSVSRLGEGVAIKVMDSSHLSHPKLVRHLRDVAEANDSPYQLEILPRGGTDAGAMQLAGVGAPAVTLSIPTRYVHTVNEMAARSDIAAAIALLARFLEDAGSRR
ncbi:MAG TPA: M42 family metallopeptidase, partial [Thermomicrobiales bacterium]|nr:M42 family metallopeptidase [Thermomicrobiales bacterium]